MTQTKIERLRKELMESHGDVTLLEMRDKATGTVTAKVPLSKAEIKCTSDMKDVQKIIKSGKPRVIFN